MKPFNSGLSMTSDLDLVSAITRREWFHTMMGSFFQEDYDEKSENGALTTQTKDILLQQPQQQGKQQPPASSSSSSSGPGWGYSHSMGGHTYYDQDEYGDHLQPLSWGSPNVQVIAMREVSLLSISEAKLVLNEIPVYSENARSKQKEQSTTTATTRRVVEHNKGEGQEAEEELWKDRNGAIRGQQPLVHYQEAALRVRTDVESRSAILYCRLPTSRSHVAQSAFSKGLCGFGEQSE